MSDVDEAPSSLPPAPTRPSPLPLWRSLDWRFLLPADDIQTIAYLPTVPSDEGSVIEEAGLTVSEGEEAGLDLVVLAADGRAGMETAFERLRPGGWLLLRLGGRARPWTRFGRRSVHAWVRQAEARGFTVDAAYWHAPNAQRSSYIVALHDRPAIAAMLKRHQGVRFGSVKSVIARAVNRSGMAHVMAADVTVVAQRPGYSHGAPVHQPAKRSLLPAELEAGLVSHLPGPSRLLVTPWEEASRHVVCLYLDVLTGSSRAVAKLPRRNWDVGGIRHESSALEELSQRTDALTGLVPKVHTVRLDGARPFLLESPLRGRAVSPDVAVSVTPTLLAAGLGFVEHLPKTGTTDEDQSWFARLVENPLREVADLVDLADVPPLVERTLHHLQSLRTAVLPLVFEHGDLSHPNLFLSDGGRLAAADWERAEAYGLPVHDLCFLLQYISECRAGAVDREAQRRAFDDAFTGRRAWALPWLRRYATAVGVDEPILPGLLLASWARSSAGLLTRLSPPEQRVAQKPGTKTSVDANVAAAFSADRDFELWRHAADRFEHLLG
jgi:hypothetical protein